MKESFTKKRYEHGKVWNFFNGGWRLSIAFSIALVLGMMTLPPNFLNPNRATGKVCRLYEQSDYMSPPVGRGGVWVMQLHMILCDSSKYVFSHNSIATVQKANILGKEVKITYRYHSADQHLGVHKLVVGDEVIFSSGKYLFWIWLFFFIWTVWGIGSEIRRMWREA